MTTLAGMNIRYRISISTTSKGLPSWECTIDSQDSGASVARIEAETHALVRRLAARYKPGIAIIDETMNGGKENEYD
jgi:hypothetical protein